MVLNRDRRRLLSPRTFRIEWELHAWVGVIASLLAFVVCFFGIFGVFREDFIVWQDPALHVPASAASAEGPAGFDAVLAAVTREHPVTDGATIGLVRHPGTRLFFAYTFDPTTEGSARLWVDPATGSVLRERTGLAEELFAMHFFDRLPHGVELSGVVAIALLVALVGGLVIHLKDLPRQWWRVRPAMKLRFAASDIHKVLGVFGLPFALVLCWSGANLSLANIVNQGFALVTPHASVRQIEGLRGRPPIDRPLAHRAAAGLDPGVVIRLAQERLGTRELPDFVELQHLGDESAWIGVSFTAPGLGGRRHTAFDGVTGQLLADTGDRPPPTQRFEELLAALHFGRYAGRFLEVLYALLALALCAVIVTGNLVWLERRDAHRARRGNRILEGLTVGVCAGAAVAAAAYCAANRLLPWSLEQRAATELRLFFVAWAVSIGAGFLPSFRPRSLAAALLVAASALFALVVALDLARLETNLATALGREVPHVFVAELVLVSLALAGTVLAYRLGPTARRRDRHRDDEKVGADWEPDLGSP